MSKITDVAEKLYKEVNPDSTMGGPPSMVYEIIEEYHKRWLQMSKSIRDETPFEDFVRLLLQKDPLTKDQAILACSWGYKITHKTFMRNEYLKRAPKSKVHFKDEEDNVINMKQFWKYRTKAMWNTDWSIYKSK